MSKCCSSVITFWCYFAGLKSSRNPDSSHHLHNCDTNTLGSPIIPTFSIGISTCELGLTSLDVNDGVCCLPSKNCVLVESKASRKIDVSVLFKTLSLKIK